MVMRSFASDNNSGVHPRIMDAIIKANDNHAVGYGDDPWTEAATAKIREVFGEGAAPFDKSFHLLLNLAVGGNYDGGRMPSADELPARMKVDYVKWYQK